MPQVLTDSHQPESLSTHITQCYLGGLESPHFLTSDSPRRTLPRLGGPLRLGETCLGEACLGEDFCFLQTPCPRLGEGCPIGTRTSDHFSTQKWKINQVGRVSYLLERRRNPKKPRGRFPNSKPLISQTPRLDPRQNLAFSIPTCSPRRCNELSFLA